MKQVKVTQAQVTEVTGKNRTLVAELLERGVTDCWTGDSTNFMFLVFFIALPTPVLYFFLLFIRIFCASLTLYNLILSCLKLNIAG